MDSKAFEAELRADGYTEIETKTLEPRPANVAHGHPYAVRGYVLSGAFIVTQDDNAVSYQPGQSFSVVKGKLHTEAVGPEGSQVVVGRKY